MIFFILSLLFIEKASAQALKVPETGAFFGAYVDAGPLSDQVNQNAIRAFEKEIERPLSWVLFSNNWLNGQIEFPSTNVQKIRELKRVPYIRLMPWTQVRSKGGPDPIFTMEKFIQGDFDPQLKAWARAAQKSPGPYILEFGPEANGNWFPWNGQWNGGGVRHLYGDPLIPDGPERFRDAYRRLITLFAAEGLRQVTWVFHVDTAKLPYTSWNKAEYYYPGDDYIDWIGLSVFGAQLPNHQWIQFESKIKNFWPEIRELTRKKPLIISEFGVIEDSYIPSRKAQWLTNAFALIESQKYSIKGATYWNSIGWYEDGSASFKISSSLQSRDQTVEIFKKPFWTNSPTVPEEAK